MSDRNCFEFAEWVADNWKRIGGYWIRKDERLAEGTKKYTIKELYFDVYINE